MKLLDRSIIRFSLAVLCAALVVPFATADTNAQAKKTAKHKVTAVRAITWPETCPVTGTKIPSLADAAGSSVYKGKTYYFCCSMCKPLFDKNPAKYADAAAKGHYLGTPM